LKGLRFEEFEVQLVWDVADSIIKAEYTVRLPSCTSCVIKKPIKADLSSVFMGFLNLFLN